MKKREGIPGEGKTCTKKGLEVWKEFSGAGARGGLVSNMS